MEENFLNKIIFKNGLNLSVLIAKRSLINIQNDKKLITYKRKLKFGIYFFIFPVYIHSQQLPSDNLKKAETFSRKIDSLSNKNFSNAFKLQDLALKFSKKMGLRKYEADYLRLKGNIYYLKGSLDSASICYFQSLNILENENFPDIKAKLYNNLGRFYRKIKDYRRALNYYNQALNIYKTIDDEEGLATIYNESGVVYEEMKNYDEAKNRYLKSLAIQKKRNDLVGQGYSLEFIGEVLTEEQKYADAEWYLLNSLKIRKKTNDNFATL